MSERNRILIIDNLAVESSRRSLYRELAKRNEFEIHLLVPHAWKETTHIVQCEPESSSSLHIHPTGILFGFRHHRVMYAGLFRIIRELHPDFVLAVHAPENYATIQLLVARKLYLPSMDIGLFASRNIDLPAVGFPFKLAFMNGFCDWLTARSQVDVVFHRPQSFGYLYQRYTDKVLYIPHSVDCSTFKPDASDSKKGTDNVIIGYVGRLTGEKGVHILIEAMSRLPMRVELIIRGEGSHRRKLQSLVTDLGLADRVRFESLVSYAAMPAHLNRLDVLVLPSLETTRWKELFGRVLIEAMACEVPVVASDSGGIPEVVGDSGILFRVGSATDLAEKLLDLVSSYDKRKDRGMKGRERVLKLYDIPVVAKQLAENLTGFLHT
jgi:glycosyltransferase involved in cell wall biosynthesis